jgi:hypothetical protein
MMTENQTLTLKRKVTVKTMVTDAFREKALAELTDEQRLVKTELESLEQQYQANLRQLEEAARGGHNVSAQLDQLHREAQTRQTQLNEMAAQLQAQLAELEKVTNGTFITTGQLENYVPITVGDALYEKLRNAEILVKDGVVTAIIG